MNHPVPRLHRANTSGRPALLGRRLSAVLLGGIFLLGASHFWTSAVAADVTGPKPAAAHFVGEASIPYSIDAISAEVGDITGKEVRIKADILFCKSSVQPTGSLSADFKGANMVMKASTLDWLVVSPKQIEMKGPCFLDDSDGFVFQMKIEQNAENGKRRVRLKVWEAAKPSHVVFDNQRDENWNAPFNPATEMLSGNFTVG